MNRNVPNHVDRSILPGLIGAKTSCKNVSAIFLIFLTRGIGSREKPIDHQRYAQPRTIFMIIYHLSLSYCGLRFRSRSIPRGGRRGDRSRL